MINLEDVQPGYYIAQEKDSPDSQFLCVVWGTYPFLQAYRMATDLAKRPSFEDVRDMETCEFVQRVPAAKELAGELRPVEQASR